jgi:hypothetical protein
LGYSPYIRGINTSKNRPKLRSITNTYGNNAPVKLLKPGKKDSKSKNSNEKNGVAKPTNTPFAGRIAIHEAHHTTAEATSTHPAAGAVWAPTWADMAVPGNEMCGVG